MDNTLIALLVLVMLQVKHWIFDFPLQVDYQLKNKGTYGHPGGLIHAGSHSVGTFIAITMVFSFSYWFFAIVLALLDFVVHYHVDWIKMRYGCNDISDRRFWSHLGLDQMVHQITYIVIAGICVL
jgi:hypothetical protein